MKQLQEKLRKIQPFAITDDSVCWIGHTYYAQTAPLFRFWNRADLLLLADRYALKGYRKDVEEYVECLEKASGNSV